MTCQDGKYEHQDEYLCVFVRRCSPDPRCFRRSVGKTLLQLLHELRIRIACMAWQLFPKALLIALAPMQTSSASPPGYSPWPQRAPGYWPCPQDEKPLVTLVESRSSRRVSAKFFSCSSSVSRLLLHRASCSAMVSTHERRSDRLLQTMHMLMPCSCP